MSSTLLFQLLSWFFDDINVCYTECDIPVPGIPVPRNSSIFLMVSEPISKKFGTEKSLGTGLEKNEYRKKSRNRSQKILVPKKVSESVSKKFGTEKSLGIGIVQILGLVTHWTTDALLLKLSLIGDSSTYKDLFSKHFGSLLGPYLFFRVPICNVLGWFTRKIFIWVPIRSLFHKKGDPYWDPIS